MRLTFMMGMGSSPGVPRSSIMFLMSIERSAMMRSTMSVSRASRDGRRASAHTSLDVDAIGADQDDLLVIGGSHVVMDCRWDIGLCVMWRKTGVGVGCLEDGELSRKCDDNKGGGR